MRVVCCGLLAKSLRLGLGPGVALGVLLFFSSSVISVLIFLGLASMRRITDEFSIDDVTAT